MIGNFAGAPAVGVAATADADATGFDGAAEAVDFELEHLDSWLLQRHFSFSAVS